VSEVVNDRDRDLKNFYDVLKDPELFGRLRDRLELTLHSEDQWNASRELLAGAAGDAVARAAALFTLCRQSLEGSSSCGGSASAAPPSPKEKASMNRQELEAEVTQRGRALRERLVREGTFTPQGFRAALRAEPLRDLREEIFAYQVSQVGEEVDHEYCEPQADLRDGVLKLRDGRRRPRQTARPEHFAEAEALAREELAAAIKEFQAEPAKREVAASPPPPATTTSRCPRRLILLVDGEDSAAERILAEYTGSEGRGKGIHDEVQRLAAEHRGKLVAAEWLGPLGWVRFLWCRKG
jgi:hypothetical protein